MTADPRFEGEPVGYGLFLPNHRGGWTEDFVFGGPHVQHILCSKQSRWQLDGNYSIADRWDVGYIFVPKTSQCHYKLFRVQHQESDPSHALVQEEDEKYMLVSIRPMGREEQRLLFS